MNKFAVGRALDTARLEYLGAIHPDKELKRYFHHPAGIVDPQAMALALVMTQLRCRVMRVLVPAQLIFYRDNTWSAGRYIPGVLCVLG